MIYILFNFHNRRRPVNSLNIPLADFGLLTPDVDVVVVIVVVVCVVVVATGGVPGPPPDPAFEEDLKDSVDFLIVDLEGDGELPEETECFRGSAGPSFPSLLLLFWGLLLPLVLLLLLLLLELGLLLMSATEGVESEPVTPVEKLVLI